MTAPSSGKGSWALGTDEVQVDGYDVGRCRVPVEGAVHGVTGLADDEVAGIRRGHRLDRVVPPGVDSLEDLQDLEE